MKKLDIYLVRQFLTVLLMALLGFITIFIIVDIFEQLDKFIDSSVPFPIILRYYFYSLPWFFNIGLPMAVLIATVFSIGIAAKRNELTAMKATGISLYRVAVPLFVIGFIISLISFQFEDRLVIWGNVNRAELKKEYIQKYKRRSKNIKTNIFLQRSEKYHIAIGKYNYNQKSADDVTVQIMNQGQISERIDIQKITWIDSLEYWAVSRYSIRNFNLAGEEEKVRISATDTLLYLGFSPADVERKSSSPEELSYADLKDFIAQLDENGVDTTRWEVVRDFKISFAFTNLIVVLFGLPLVLLKPKGGLSFGAGMSVLVIFSYYAFIKFGQSLGYKGIIEPIYAAWMGNVVFSIGGILLLLGVRK
ncbi:MAG: YjgP/YjgQ family permease [Candidatus Marinimicrobia bacterium]|nr:YjgP/YjgQ family permease [Candidatus Neomarinimicrobiota bacterium]